MTSRASTLSDMNALAEQGGGSEKVKQQHAMGKLTARERVDALLDPGSFIELDKFKSSGGDGRVGEGLVTGYGFIDGRQVFVYAQDFTVDEGQLSRAQAEKICKVMDLAKQVGAPVLGIYDSSGLRLEDGVSSIAGGAEILVRHMQASGVVPQIACVMGPCTGSAAYAPAIADFVLMTQGAGTMCHVTPDVVKAVSHADLSAQELGGALAHAQKSGLVHFVTRDDHACIDKLRELLSFLPSNNAEDPPRVEFKDDPDRRTPGLASLIPESPTKPYDMKGVVTAALDDGRFVEVHEQFARNVIVGFGRLCGRTVGVVANQPRHLAGCLDNDAAVKAARFVRFCDCFNVPLLTFVDAPGFLPSAEQEHCGIIRNAAQLLYAYAEATVPKVTVVTRKAYGDAYIVMSSKHIRGDINFAFPSAEISVMAPESVVNITHQAELAAASDREALHKKLSAEYRDTMANPFKAAELGYVDEVIQPEMLRPRLVRAFAMLRDKRQSNPPRKHGNIPL